MGSLDALPSTTRVDVPRVTSGTIRVQTSPPRAGGPKAIASPRAPRPRAPRAEAALVGLGLAVEGAVGPAGLRNAGAGHAVVAAGRVAVEARRGAAESAVASARNSLGSSPNLRSERCESLTYLFFGAFLLLMA